MKTVHSNVRDGRSSCRPNYKQRLQKTAQNVAKRQPTQSFMGRVVEKRVRRRWFEISVLPFQFTFPQFLSTHTIDLIHSLLSYLEAITLVDVVLDYLALFSALDHAVGFEALGQIHDQLGTTIAVLIVDDVAHLRRFDGRLRSSSVGF